MSKKYLNYLIILLLTVSIVITSSLVYSQEKESANLSNSDGSFPVKLGGETLFYIKNSTERYSAEARANKISEEIESIAKTRVIDLDEFQVVDKGGNRVISLENFIVTLTPQDFESEENSRGDVENEIKERLTSGIKKYRENYNQEQNLERTILTISIIFSLFLLIVIPFYTSTFTGLINTYQEFQVSNLQKLSKFLQRVFRSRDLGTSDEKTFEYRYKVGDLDKSGKLIKDIYHYKEDFIIYRTIDSVEWIINCEKEDIESLEYGERINKILYLLARVESLNPKEIGRTDTINRLIAKGMRLALQNDIEDSQKVLKEAEQRLQELRINHSKRLYLIASFYASSLIIFTMASINYMNEIFDLYFINVLERLQIPFTFSIVIICGSMGGLLSVVSGINEIVIDPDDDFCVTGISRIFIAVISSMIFYIALRANVIGEISRFFLDNPDSPDIWKVAFISTFAGFTESLVPNLLKDKSSKGKGKLTA